MFWRRKYRCGMGSVEPSTVVSGQSAPQKYVPPETHEAQYEIRSPQPTHRGGASRRVQHEVRAPQPAHRRGGASREARRPGRSPDMPTPRPTPSSPRAPVRDAGLRPEVVSREEAARAMDASSRSRESAGGGPGVFFQPDAGRSGEGAAEEPMPLYDPEEQRRAEQGLPPVSAETTRPGHSGQGTRVAVEIGAGVLVGFAVGMGVMWARSRL